MLSSISFLTPVMIKSSAYAITLILLYLVGTVDSTVFSNPANTLISDLVKTQFGYHIILVGDKSEACTVAFETAKERIAHYLHESAWHQQVQQYLGGLFASADIQGIEIKGA